MPASLVPRLAGLTRFTPIPLLQALRPTLSMFLRNLPGWRALVARGMEAALGVDGFRRRHVDDYFHHLAVLAAFSAAAYRSGLRAAGLERQWTHDPASVDCYRRALVEGKGALMVCPHL